MTLHAVGDDLVPLLAALVAFDTAGPAGAEVAMAAALRDRLAAHRPDRLVLAEVARPSDGGAPRPPGAYVLASWGTPRLLINAHLDTVPALDGWATPPHSLQVDGDRLTALGAADTKGAIAAILSALGAGAPRDTAVLFSGDEEVSTACMRAFLRDHLPSTCTTAIVCEPTSCTAGTSHRGFIALEVEAEGPGGHSSNADRTAAPVLELSAVASALGAWSRAREARATGDGMCVNAAEIRGSAARNVIPPRATLTVSLRPPAGTALDDVLAEVHRLVASASPSSRVREAAALPSFRTRDLAPFRRWLGDGAASPRALDFWTEAALLAGAGVNAVVYGPGDIAVAHRADEHVSLRELERARAAFVAAFAEGKVDAST